MEGCGSVSERYVSKTNGTWNWTEWCDKMATPVQQRWVRVRSLDGETKCVLSWYLHMERLAEISGLQSSVEMWGYGVLANTHSLKHSLTLCLMSSTPFFLQSSNSCYLFSVHSLPLYLENTFSIIDSHYTSVKWIDLRWNYISHISRRKDGTDKCWKHRPLDYLQFNYIGRVKCILTIYCLT